MQRWGPTFLSQTSCACLGHPDIAGRGLTWATRQLEAVSMKKQFKGELCVYCGKALATTADHVVSREFFLVRHRDNLPQVPACDRCNNEKAALEHYLTAVLVFGGRHPHAAETLSTMGPKRLAKNAKLQRELAAGYAKSGGTSIPIDHKPLDRLFAMIAQGLAWHHWRVRLAQQHSATASMFHDGGAWFFDQMLTKWATPHRVSEDLGGKTFVYQGAQATDCPEMTIWRFWMYGGVVLIGDSKLPGPASLAVAVTGPSALVQKLQFKGAARRKNSAKIGRNEPCACGSGKKYKKCCGA